MVGEADVTIKYAFLPTTESIKAGAEKIAKEYAKKLGIGTKGFGGSSQLNKSMQKSTKKMTSEFDKTVSGVVDLLRMTQIKTSLQTKLMSGMKLAKSAWGKITGKPVEAASGGGEAAAGAGGAASGGGIAGALVTMVGLLTVISIAMLIMSAFFEAVGPFIKVVMKMLSAIILILLMPFLKRIMPLLTGFFTSLIEFSKETANGLDKMFDKLESGTAGVPEFIAVILTGFLGPFFRLFEMGMSGMFSDFDVAGLFDEVDDALVIIGTDMKKAFKDQLENPLSILNTLLNTNNETLDKQLLRLLGNLIAFNGEFAAGGRIYLLLQNIGWFDKSLKVNFQNIIDLFFGWMFNLDDALYNLNTWIEVTLFNVLANFANKVIWAYNQISNLLSPIIAIGSMTGIALKDYTEPRNSSDSDYMGLQTMTPMSDFISRPGGGMVPFSPNDTIIGMKDTSGLGVNITNNLTVSAGVDKTEFKKLLTEFSRQQARDLRTRTSYYGR